MTGPDRPNAEEVTVLREALTTIKKSAAQAGHWPPERIWATIDGIEKVASRALAILEREQRG